MSLIKYIDRMKRMDQLIRTKATGPPEEFSRKIGVCKSVLLDHINELKRMDAPIAYDRVRRSYYYVKDVRLIIDFRDKSIKGGKNFSFFIDPNIPEYGFLTSNYVK